LSGEQAPRIQVLPGGQNTSSGGQREFNAGVLARAAVAVGDSGHLWKPSHQWRCPILTALIRYRHLKSFSRQLALRLANRIVKLAPLREHQLGSEP
jgi:hypothetical protein